VGEKKQATLFAMLPPDQASKKGKSSKAKKGETSDGATDGDAAAKPTMLNDDSETQLVETPTEETQGETQPVDESMEETQPAGDDEEPIEWPESPPREVLVS
jgi:hypothetical protein